MTEYSICKPFTMDILLVLSGDISLNPGPGSRYISGCLLNIRSVRNKSAAFAEFVNENNTDLFGVTETWLKPDDTESFISSITPPGFNFTHIPRYGKKGGGVGFFIRENLDFKLLSTLSFQTFENISIQINSEGAQGTIFHLLYRPPNLSKAQFLDDFGVS